MKITVVSIFFFPQIGGVENIMFGLARQWSAMGHDVTVFTATPGTNDHDYGFKIIRSLDRGKLIKAVRSCDIFFEANISLRTWWIGMLNRKKWFVLHHLTYTHVQRWQEVIKNKLTLFAINISVSQYVASTLKGKSIVIPNFFNPQFTRDYSIQKDKDIVFVGRLVSDKGVDDLLKALVVLKNQRKDFTCTIIGDGPEKSRISQMIIDLGLAPFVKLAGLMSGQSLVTEINRHRVMVVPSKWPEPFGVVVLEGLACGCRIVCSSQGGLPEAAHGFGLLYPNDDIGALAMQIEKANNADLDSSTEADRIDEYLGTRTAAAIASRYIDFFKSRLANIN